MVLVYACVLCRRGCGRKRKGTPVKVFVSNAEEESVSEHSFGPGVCLCMLYLCVCVCVLGTHMCVQLCYWRGGRRVYLNVTYFCACVLVCMWYVPCDVHMHVCVGEAGQ